MKRISLILILIIFPITLFGLIQEPPADDLQVITETPKPTEKPELFGDILTEFFNLPEGVPTIAHNAQLGVKWNYDNRVIGFVRFWSSEIKFSDSNENFDSLWYPTGASVSVNYIYISVLHPFSYVNYIRLGNILTSYSIYTIAWRWGFEGLEFDGGYSDLLKYNIFYLKSWADGYKIGIKNEFNILDTKITGIILDNKEKANINTTTANVTNTILLSHEIVYSGEIERNITDNILIKGIYAYFIKNKWGEDSDSNHIIDSGSYLTNAQITKDDAWEIKLSYNYSALDGFFRYVNVGENFNPHYVGRDNYLTKNDYNYFYRTSFGDVPDGFYNIESIEFNNKFKILPVFNITLDLMRNYILTDRDYLDKLYKIIPYYKLWKLDLTGTVEWRDYDIPSSGMIENKEVYIGAFEIGYEVTSGFRLNNKIEYDVFKESTLSKNVYRYYVQGIYQPSINLTFDVRIKYSSINNTEESYMWDNYGSRDWFFKWMVDNYVDIRATWRF